MNIFKRRASKVPDNSNEFSESKQHSESKQQILEIQHKLIEFMQKTTVNLADLTGRLDKIQAEIEKPSTEPSEIKNSVDLDAFKKMETKVAEMSEEIEIVNNLVNGTIKNYIQEIYLYIQEQKEKQKTKLAKKKK